MGLITGGLVLGVPLNVFIMFVRAIEEIKFRHSLVIVIQIVSQAVSGTYQVTLNMLRNAWGAGSCTKLKTL